MKKSPIRLLTAGKSTDGLLTEVDPSSVVRNDKGDNYQSKVKDSSRLVLATSSIRASPPHLNRSKFMWLREKPLFCIPMVVGDDFEEFDQCEFVLSKRDLKEKLGQTSPPKDKKKEANHVSNKTFKHSKTPLPSSRSPLKNNLANLEPEPGKPVRDLEAEEKRKKDKIRKGKLKKSMSVAGASILKRTNTILDRKNTRLSPGTDLPKKKVQFSTKKTVFKYTPVTGS